MDSFVLAETFKYLYLLFADASDLIIDVDSFVFTTEGHLLPLSLARLSPSTAVPVISTYCTRALIRYARIFSLLNFEELS